MRRHRLILPLFALLAACSPASPGRTQASAPPLAEPVRHTPTDAASMKLSFAPVVKKAAPAVVNVYARRVVRQQVDPFWQLFGGGVPRDRVEQSLGSGVLVRSDGIVVTNNHVVEGGQEFMVVLADRRELPAKVLLADARTDLAVLKIDVGAERLPTLAIDDTGDTQVGDLVLAIGDPFGVGQTVTNGIVSAVNRTDVGQGAGSYIQTDAAINPGNSGGALVDMDGDLIGINSMILSGSGTSSGVGFAIPAALVKRVVQTAVGGGKTFIRPWLGVQGDAVTGDIAKSLGADRPQGVLVSDLYPGGSAQRAGLKVGDVILSVDGRPVNDAAGVAYIIATHGVGDEVPLALARNGQHLSLKVRCEAPPSTPARDQRTLTGAHPLNGATVVNVSPAVADELGVDPFSHGVLVTAVSGAGFASSAGFQPGDFIRAVNNQKTDTVAALAAALTGRHDLWTVTVERGGHAITAQFRG